MIKEPDFKQDSSMNMVQLLNFYSSEFTFQESKKWALEWLFEAAPEQAQRLQNVKEHQFSNRGFLCRAYSRGYPLADSTIADLHRFFERISSPPEATKTRSVDKKDKPEPMNSIIFQLEDVVDAAISQTEIPDVVIPVDDQQLKTARCWIEKEMVEVQETLRQHELILEKLQEAYARCGGVLEAAQKEKKTRRARTTTAKPKPATQVFKSFRYCKSDESLNIQSISPLKIIGAKKLLVYNTEYRIATLYVAQDKDGLGVSGTSIKNYCEAKSYAQKIRKPEVFLAASDYMVALSEQRTTQAKARSLTSTNTVLLTV